MRIACGRCDPFFPVVHDFAHRLDPVPETSFGAGAHTLGYWRSVAPADLAFVSRHLAGGAVSAG